MKNAYRLLACLFLTLALPCGKAQEAPAAILGKDGPPDMFTKPPSENDMTMRLLSLNGQSQVYYLKNGPMFAPVKFSAKRDLRTKYSLPKADIVDFYRRDVLEDQIYFTKVFSINPKGASDIIGGLYAQKNGGFKTFSADISLDKIPAGTFCAVNMSPHPMGFSIDKRTNKKLGIFESLADEGKVKDGLATVSLDVYDLRNPKSPAKMTSRRYVFRSDRRYIALFFDLPKVPESVTVKGVTTVTSPPDTFVMNDKGPR